MQQRENDRTIDGGYSVRKQEFLYHTFGVMALGLLVTFAVAWLLATFAPWLAFRPLVALLVSVAEVITVVSFSRRILMVRYAAAVGMFLFFSALTGVMFSSIFLLFEIGSIFLCFLAAAAAFAVMAVYGRTTGRDLQVFRGWLLGGLVGLLLLSLIGILFRISAMEILISAVGVVVFLGMTAYDVQNLSRLYESAVGTQVEGKLAVFGALQLYLDFINLLQYFILLFGRRRRQT